MIFFPSLFAATITAFHDNRQGSAYRPPEPSGRNEVPEPLGLQAAGRTDARMMD